MISKIVIPHRNARYRIFTMKDKHYLLDLDRPVLSILFPFIIWFIPHTVYQIDKYTYEELKAPNKEKQKKSTDKKARALWSVILPIGFIAPFIGRLLAPTADGFDDLLSIMLTRVFLTFYLVLTVSLRIYLSKKIYKRVDKIVGGINTLPKNKIKIRPKKLSNYFMALFGYFLFGVLFIIGLAMSVDFNNLLIGIVSSMIGFMFLILNMTWFLFPGDAKVKYLDDKHEEIRRT